MKILVLGSGGREHALAWKLRASPRCEAVYLHPGNAGTRRAGYASLGEGVTDATAILRESRAKGISLVVIGPEAMLAEGFADKFRSAGLAVVGPARESARLETSKVFAKEFMQRAGIPTAPFSIVDSETKLLARVAEGIWPTVLKLDGLAAGKGVAIAKTEAEVKAFAKRVWGSTEFGPGPHRIVIETFLPGDELSYMGLCDGETFLPLSSATDFKRVHDGDRGPNTGGMGAISPSPFFSPALADKVEERITSRVLAQLRKEGLSYRGVLYVGLMISHTGEPYVLEFNARFGDPETQAILLRLESDFSTMLEHTANGQLRACPPIRWKEDTAVYVVGAAEGYPEKVATGDPISGLDALGPEAAVFFSGVQEKDGHLATNGGRVLGVGVTESSRERARAAVYAALRHIQWRGMHFRSDIGA